MFLQVREASRCAKMHGETCDPLSTFVEYYFSEGHEVMVFSHSIIILKATTLSIARASLSTASRKKL